MDQTKLRVWVTKKVMQPPKRRAFCHVTGVIQDMTEKKYRCPPRSIFSNTSPPNIQLIGLREKLQ